MSDISSRSSSAIDVGIKGLRRQREPLRTRAPLQSPDDALLIVGDPGRYHYLQFIVLSLQFMTLVMADLIPIFYNLSPQAIICSDDLGPAEKSTNYILGRNSSSDDYCRCDGTLTYIYKVNQTSLIADMNLICDKKPLASLATSVYYVGSAVAGPFVGWMSDKHGRRPALLGSCLLFAAINVSLIFVKDYILFVVLRFIAGVARVGIYSTLFVLQMEWTVVSRRTIVAAASEFFFPCGVITLALSAYYLQQWRHIQTATAICNAVFILNIWFAPESIQWLIANGRIREAVETVRTISRFNRRPVFREDIKAVENMASDQALTATQNVHTKRYSVLDCFRDPQIRRYTILISILWFSTNFGYPGLSYLMETLTSNVAIDLAIGGALEMIPCAITTIVAIKFGKKYPIMTFLLLAGLLAIGAGFIPPDMRLRTFVALTARMCLVGSYCLMFLYASELFPTPIRSRGFGIAYFFFMFGGMLSPQLSLLKNFITPATPVLIVGGVALVGALAVLALPEKSKPLYERLE